MRPRILTLHPYAGSVAPMAAAFRDVWPEAEALNLVDESLFADMRNKAAPAADPQRRIRMLLDYADCVGARAAILTAAAYGPVIDRLGPTPIPVIRPERELAHAALALGRRFALICTVGTAAPLIADSIRGAAARSSTALDIVEHVLAQAQSLLENGEQERHDKLIADYAVSLEGYDAILLGQVSMAGARRYLPLSHRDIVLCSPELAVRRTKSVLNGRGSSGE